MITDVIDDAELKNGVREDGTIYSVYRYRNLWPQAIQAVSSGLIPVKDIVSHEFPFDQCIEGIQYSLEHKDEVIKSVIKMV